MNRKILIAAALLAALPWSAEAQVGKQVEVTKAYEPRVESAAKLAIAPDMTDTVRMRPEIDYTVTPLSLQTTLTTRPIRPATVTYWEFNRPLPFYIKAGAGYPLNSVLDLYAASQHPSTGYVLGFVNHEGRYADIRNDAPGGGLKNNSLRMLNRIGGAAGKYIGSHVLEAEIGYENRLYHRYGIFGSGSGADSPYSGSVPAPGSTIDYGDLSAKIRIGDDFQNLSRTNFEVELHGNLFFDHSELPDPDETKGRQTDFGVSAKIARGFGRHRFSIGAGCDMAFGRPDANEFLHRTIRAGIRYGLNGGVVRLEAGADYCHDRIELTDWDPEYTTTGNYLLPFLRLDFKLGTPGIRPFAEADGTMRSNGLRELALSNPYLDNGLDIPDRSSVEYDGRIGIGGTLGRGRFDYRIFAGISLRDNHLYWVNPATAAAAGGSEPETLLPALPVLAHQSVTSFNAEAIYRPVSTLSATLGVHAYAYDDDTAFGNGAPALEADLGFRYEGRKIAAGISLRMQSGREWSYLMSGTGAEDVAAGTFEAPFAVDLRICFDWRVSRRVGIFAEGRNLLDRRLYEWAWYPEYGANCTLGVKVAF